jgi:polyketide synthase PksN
MARAAIEHALNERSESARIELRDTVWARPVIVSENKHVDIALLTDDGGQFEYEIYSEDGSEEIVHCQGRAVLSREPVPARLELAQLEEQMTQGQLDPAVVYTACARMGLLYGPSFQGVKWIRRGADQALAQLRLPAAIENTSGEYVLHPSLLDSAGSRPSGFSRSVCHVGRAALPFAVESRIIRPCTTAMFAWVRLRGWRSRDRQHRQTDIDLCDEDGNVCIQMRGFALRVQSRPAAGQLFATPVWQTSEIAASAVADDAEHHIVLCDLPDLEIDVLELSVPRSRCTVMRAQRYVDAGLACLQRIQAILQSKPATRCACRSSPPIRSSRVCPRY